MLQHAIITIQITYNFKDPVIGYEEGSAQLIRYVPFDSTLRITIN